MHVKNSLFGVCVLYIINRHSYLKHRQPRQLYRKGVKQFLKANISLKCFMIKYSLPPLGIHGR